MALVDRATIKVEAGRGGDGLVAFHREKYVPAGGPSGGSGGDGGAIALVASENLQTLLDFQYSPSFRAASGQRGGPKNRTGASGADRHIAVPCGTVAYDAETGERLGDLVAPGQTLTVARGGRGGWGNRRYLSNHNRAPERARAGGAGQRRRLALELKLLADVGVVGLPNAGKSTLIAALSQARPKIADYPFTTLAPNLGVVRHPSGDSAVWADIPGLIAGAHAGVGLGHDFLRHIERTRALVHAIDMTAPDPIADFKTLRAELAAYQPQLARRASAIALTKADALDSAMQSAIAQALSERTEAPIHCISAVSGAGLEALLASVQAALADPAAPAGAGNVALPQASW